MAPELGPTVIKGSLISGSLPFAILRDSIPNKVPFTGIGDYDLGISWGDIVPLTVASNTFPQEEGCCLGRAEAGQARQVVRGWG